MSKSKSTPVENYPTSRQLSVRFKQVEEARKIKRAIEKSSFIQGQAIPFNLFAHAAPVAVLNQRFQAVQDRPAVVGADVTPL